MYMFSPQLQQQCRTLNTFNTHANTNCIPDGSLVEESGYPHWHGIFVLLYRTNPNLVKYQWKQQWLPVDPVRTVDILPVDMMEWPTFVSQSRLMIFTWGIIKLIIIPYVKIVSCDWLTKVGHSIMSVHRRNVHWQNVHRSHWIYRQSLLFSLIIYQIGVCSV